MGLAQLAASCAGVVAVHQVRKRQAQCVRQRLQSVDIRQTDAAFPAADGLVGHMQLLGKLGLRQSLFPPHPGKKSPERFASMQITSFSAE